MKDISEDLSAHLGGEVTSLATCWKLTRRDSTVLGFTNHDNDLLFEDVQYKASSGFTPSAVENTGTLSVDNLDVEGMLTSGSITEADIMAGRYDFAAIDIFQLNYKDLTQGKMMIKRGWLGEVSLHKQHFVAEVRGVTQRLSQTIGELFSPSCRAALGDSRCKVNMATHTVTGSISAVATNQDFSDSSRSEATDVYSAGVITFTSGANNGLSMEVKEYIHTTAGGKIILALAMPYAVSVGDNYSLTKGCDKTLGTCKTKFNNVLNFRGEPHVPGIDRMLETAGTKSS